MTTLISASSITTVEGLTRAQLIRGLALKTALCQTGTVSTTSSDGSSFTDTVQLKSSQYNSSMWRGGWARIASTSAHAAPEAEFKPIAKYDPALGMITVDPRFSAAPSSGDTYELWRVNPKVVLDIIDRILTDDLYLPCWTVLSEVPDYDMEQPGTTDWTVGGTATLAKASAEPRSSLNGKRYLKVTNALSTDYARSAIMYWENTRNRQYHISAMVRVESASGKAKLSVWDETNNALITSQTSDKRYPVRLFLDPVTPPITCNQFSIRLGTDTAGTVCDWDEVIAQPVISRDIALPFWVKHRDQVKGIFRLAPDTIDQFIWDCALVGERDAAWDDYDISFGRNQLRAVSRMGYTTAWPLFMLGSRNETAYSDDNTDIKYVDANLFFAAVKFRLYELHSQPWMNGILDSANIDKQLASADKDFNLLLQTQQVTYERTITSPTPTGKFRDHRWDFGV